MQIVCVQPPLTQASLNTLARVLTPNQWIYTNSEQLARLRPHTQWVKEPTQQQLRDLPPETELFFVYAEKRQALAHVPFLKQLPQQVHLIVDGEEVALSTLSQPSIRCLTTPSGATLRPYQQQLVDFALDKRRVGWFVDMGLGKTLATLATLNQWYQTGQLRPDQPTLVVAPKMVALDTWTKEVAKWGYDMQVMANVGLTPKKRQAIFDRLQTVTQPTLFTTNPAQLPALMTFFQCETPPFGAVVVDELSLFKSPKAKRFKHLQALTEDLEYFIGLTGTPAPNSLLDVWSELVLVNPDIRYELGHNFFTYRSYYFMPDQVDQRRDIVYSWKLRPGASDEIYHKMSPYVMSLQSGTLIDLPTVNFTVETLTLDAKSRKIYDQMDKEIRQEMKQEDKTIVREVGTSDVSFPNTAVLKSKLLQLSTGAIYDASEQGYTVFHDQKIEKLKELLEVSTSPVLVFYNYVSDRERIMKAVPHGVWLDPHSDKVDQVIDQWNQGKIPVLLANPKSTGHGLNLQEGGHIIVWFSLTWNNEVYRQANKRLHRSGQRYPVQIIHLITEHTAEEEILPRLNRKEDQQQALMKSV